MNVCGIISDNRRIMVRKNMEEQIIYSQIASVLSLKKSYITSEKDLVRDLGACLTDIYDIFTGLEETFQISVTPERIGRVKTVKDIIDIFLPKDK